MKSNMVENIFHSPVDRLLTYGDARNFSKWPDYTALGLTADHVPELLRMVSDPALNEASENSVEVWAPVHALRALSQIRSDSAIEPLIPLLDKVDDDDWLFEDLPVVFAALGPAAVAPLSAYLNDTIHSSFARVIVAADALSRIAQKYPETRPRVVEQITEELARPDQQDAAING